MKRHTILLILITASVLSSSCVRRPLDEGPEREAPLAAEFHVVDGIRTLDKILRRPELSVTVTGGADDTVYEALFRIGDGPERTVRSIWNGVPKDLSGELLSFSEYGPLTLTGYLIDTGDPAVRIPLDTTVWMAYAPASRGPLTVKTEDRDEPLSGGTVFTAGETGTLEVSYTPEDTFLHIGVSVPEESPLELSGRGVTHTRGRYAIPFSVTAAGETVVTVTFANGRETETIEYTVTCRESEASQPDNNE